jgi:hypothetical protein
VSTARASIHQGAGYKDRIRCAKDTRRRNPPQKGFAQEVGQCEIAPLAREVLAWTQMLALASAASLGRS